MSKKMLKRSLALGALMAFVITGQAWAASVLNPTGTLDGERVEATEKYDKINNDRYGSYALGFNSTETFNIGSIELVNKISKDKEYTYGVAAFGGANAFFDGMTKITLESAAGDIVGVNNVSSSLLFKDAVTITGVAKAGYTGITSTDSSNTFIEGIRTNAGKTVFNDNVSVDLENNIQKVTQVNIVAALSDPNVADTIVEFGGDSTELKYTGKGSEIIGAFSSGPSSVINFDGNSAKISLNDIDGDYAYGAFVWYGGKLKSSLNNTLEINVSGKTSADMVGIWVDTSKGLKGSVDLDGNLSVVVNNTGSERTSGVYAKNGDVELGNNNAIVNISATSKGNAYSFYAVEGSSINVFAQTANIKGTMYVDGTSTLNLNGIQDLVIEGLTTTSDAAIQVNGGTLTVNKSGTLEIKDAGIAEDGSAQTYKVASGVSKVLWDDANLVYDRTAMFAKGYINSDIYSIEYKNAEDAFKVDENATEEQKQQAAENLEKAKEQIVVATGDEELAVSNLVEASVGQADVMKESAKGAGEFLKAVTSDATLKPEQKAAVINAAAQLAEAGGNAGTAASVASNVSNVTTGRMSFTGGAAKGGKGVGLLEEGSGAAVWTQYMHGKDEATDMPMDGGATSYESNYDGIVLGVDFKKVGKFQSGVAFNYGEGDSTGFTSAAKTKSDYDFWGIGYYGNIRNADTNFIFDINYAKSDSDVTQNTNAGSTRGVIEASPETTTWSAGVKVEKLYQNNNVQIVPYTGLRYMSIDTDEYTSKLGGETLFNYAPERQDIWLLPLGVTIKQEVVNDNGWVVTPKVDLSYVWAFGDTDSNMSVSIPGIAASNDTLGFTVMDDGSFIGLVGIEATMDDWTFGVSYSYQKGDYAESKKWFVDAKYTF